MSSSPLSSKPILKWPFFLGDGLCLVVMVTILAMAERPLSGGVAAAAVVCLIVGMALAFLPYLLEFDARAHVGGVSGGSGSGNQGRKISESADKLTQAVSRSQASAEQIEKVLASAEESNDRLAELVENLAAAASGDPAPELARIKEAVAGMEANLVSLAVSVGQLRECPAATPADLEGLSERLSRQLEELSRQPVAVPPPEEKPHPEPAAREDVALPHPVVEKTVEQESPPIVSEASPAPEMESPEGEDDAWDRDPGLEEEAGDDARFTFNEESTSLIATAYIGIGNKLFLRGDGPGLSWEKGVPMQFLSIGKWGWSALEVSEAITCRIYKNDDEPAIDGDITIEPKELKEMNPRF